MRYFLQETIFEIRIGMNFRDIILNIIRDANPEKAGFQPFPLYVALCLIIPIIIGILASVASNIVVKFLDKYFSKEDESNNC